MMMMMMIRLNIAVLRSLVVNNFATVILIVNHLKIDLIHFNCGKKIKNDLKNRVVN